MNELRPPGNYGGFNILFSILNIATIESIDRTFYYLVNFISMSENILSFVLLLYTHCQLVFPLFEFSIRSLCSSKDLHSRFDYFLVKLYIIETNILMF